MLYSLRFDESVQHLAHETQNTQNQEQQHHQQQKNKYSPEARRAMSILRGILIEQLEMAGGFEEILLLKFCVKTKYLLMPTKRINQNEDEEKPQKEGDEYLQIFCTEGEMGWRANDLINELC
ncbi:MAG: hypothetical protein EZS28_044531 [Streblomastix strix]|uniref:Uncharacterized protein n=1 Tax=Streblomastix strix TaxID=222440 RepID=A0A5J4TPU9_9EUKA|nr:MAG: hypothetical protein EZS28_044531 [Streblomastix strix]